MMKARNEAIKQREEKKKERLNEQRKKKQQELKDLKNRNKDYKDADNKDNKISEKGNEKGEEGAKNIGIKKQGTGQDDCSTVDLSEENEKQMNKDSTKKGSANSAKGEREKAEVFSRVVVPLPHGPSRLMPSKEWLENYATALMLPEWLRE